MIYLSELFDQPVKYSLRDNTSSIDGDFVIDGVTYVFKAQFEDNLNPKYQALIGTKSWGIEFRAKATSRSPYSLSITNTGNQFTVFSTIFEMLADFIRLRPNETFYFSAKEKSRKQLYDTFSQRIAKKFDYALSTFEAVGDKFYVFKTKEKTMTKMRELFDNPVPWKTFINANTLYRASFKVGRVEYRFSAELYNTYWEVDFEIMSGFTPTTNDDISKSFGITGSGNQFVVFATIKEILFDFIKEKAPQIFKFTADEESRQKLYHHFAITLERSLPYSLEEIQRTTHAIYKFTRN